MSTATLERILTRMKELGMNPRSASLASGMGSTAIRDLVRRPGNQPTLETLQKLAVGLKTTPEWLAFGNDGGSLVATEAPDTTQAVGVSGDLTVAPLRKMVPAAYGGVVDAGSFRPADEFEDDPDRPKGYEPSDPDYPRATVVIFDVMGDSMNALQPRPILSGDKLICLDFESLHNRVELREGMVVVVEQRLNGGQLRERSVKQVEIYRDRHEFCPRSTNPRHKPIVVMDDTQADDGREVQILAWVRAIRNDLPSY